MQDEQPLNPTFLTEDRLHANPRMVIMVGLPRTGKSTFVRRFVSDACKMGHPFVIVSSDDIRRALGVRYNPDLEAQVRAQHNLMVDALLLRRQHVIIDDCNLTEAARDFWKMKATAHDYQWGVAEIEQLDEDTHREECEKHNFPWKVIAGMRKVYEPVKDQSKYRYTLIKKEIQD
jgi:predicted kinase